MGRNSKNKFSNFFHNCIIKMKNFDENFMTNLRNVKLRNECILENRFLSDNENALLPLAPKYDASCHQVYVEAIQYALMQKDEYAINNIALTGDYGVGKSSILQEIAEKNKERTVKISLLTLNDGEIQQVGSGNCSQETKTNLIQKEIVKQLLYCENPEKMRDSRYHRIGQFKFGKSFIKAIFFGILGTIIAYLLWQRTSSGLFNSNKFFCLDSLLIFCIVASIVFFTLWVFHKGIQIKSVSAGPAAVSLDRKSATYFDEYLDEIVYFFEVTNRDIVIFEDIDRFNDPGIFENLRVLNGLLNRAGQLRNRNIRFIYAIKDSIFEKIEDNVHKTHDSELPQINNDISSTNRTKFFDFVIPVVPFISHRNARDHMDMIMKQSDMVSKDLMDLAASHIVDMRLMKNIHNEFVIFREKILRGNGKDLNLDENLLFSMMLYKNTNLSDFEKIRFGKSRIDYLYHVSRKIVSENLSSLASEEFKLKFNLSNLNSVEKRINDYGNKLLEYIDKLSGYLKGNDSTIYYRQENREKEFLTSRQFWEDFISTEEPLRIDVRLFNGSMVELSLDRLDVEQLIGVSLMKNDWDIEDQIQLRKRIEEIFENREFLRSADMKDLYVQEQYKFSTPDSEALSFREVVEKEQTSELTKQLIAGGYLDRNFTLYTSDYYDNRVSLRTTNFFIHCIDPNIADMHFFLESNDVESILHERGNTVLQKSGMYNIYVLDYLFENKVAEVDILIQVLKKYGDIEKKFLCTYILEGRFKNDLVVRLANWPIIFKFLLQESDISETYRTKYIDLVLQNLDHEISYETDASTREFFELRFSEFTVLSSKTTTAQQAKLIAQLFLSCETFLPDLSLTNLIVRKAMIGLNRYVINHKNLTIALGDTKNIALDTIKGSNQDIYSYVLQRIQNYLSALRSSEPSVSVKKKESFVEILNDLSACSDGQISEIVSLSDQSCMVDDILTVPRVSWPWLAENNRFPSTISNILNYVEAEGEIDDHLGGLLNASRMIIVDDNIGSEKRNVLAKIILESNRVLPNARVRVKIVSSFFHEHLPLEFVPRLPGDLIGLLVEANIVEDNADTFSICRDLPWDTKEFVISKSDNFVEFFTPDDIPANDVLDFIHSDIISDTIKLGLLDRSEEFVSDADKVIFEALAKYAIIHQKEISISEIVRWARAGVDSDLIIALLKENRQGEPEIEDVFKVLKALGGDYANLISRNGKRPKFEHSELNLWLIKYLYETNIMGSFKFDENFIYVSMRRKSQR